MRGWGSLLCSPQKKNEVFELPTITAYRCCIGLIVYKIELPEFSCLFYKTLRVRGLVGSSEVWMTSDTAFLTLYIEHRTDYTYDTLCSDYPPIEYYSLQVITLFLARIVFVVWLSEVMMCSKFGHWLYIPISNQDTASIRFYLQSKTGI